MTHAPKFWADKISDPDAKLVFWHLVTDWNFDGETAYCRILAGERRIFAKA